MSENFPTGSPGHGIREDVLGRCPLETLPGGGYLAGWESAGEILSCGSRGEVAEWLKARPC